jgi:hypothetical protein
VKAGAGRRVLQSAGVAAVLLLAGVAQAQDASAPAEPVQEPFLIDNSHTVGYRECSAIGGARLEPSADCLAVMQSEPEPAVVEVPLDTQTLYTYSYWHVQTEGPANVYDVPDGSVIRQIEPGFNFVIATDTTSAPGWIGIQGGGWMHETDISYVAASQFRGVQLLNALEQPFGWVMYPLYPASRPGGSQDPDTGRLLEKYDRFNVFASVEDSEGITWYMVGPGQWLEQRWVAVAKPVARPEGVQGRWVAVDLYEQTLIAYEDDTPVFATLVATGLPGTDTNEGLFRVWARADRDPMSGGVGSPRAYALQNVPWVLYFDGDISLHGTYWHDGFGYRRSRGCVNLSISDAHFIYDWTAANPLDENGEPLTYVFVYSSGAYGQFGISQA